MKIFNIFLLSIVIFLSACRSDDRVDGILNYDAENEAAPILEEGNYTAAVRFPAAFLEDYIGSEITGIEFYLADLPGRTVLSVFGEGTSTQPGQSISTRDVTLDVNQSSWNSFDLLAPVLIGDQDIWVGVEVDLNFDQPSIGCDPGPAIENGDFINSTGSQFSTLRDFTNGAVNINWNIRAIVE